MIGGLAAQDFNERLFLVFGKEGHSDLVEQQVKLFEKNKAALEERALKITVVPKNSGLYKKYQLQPGEFMVVLVGKDKMEKHRADKIVQPTELFSIIDAMPMRQEEIKNAKSP